MRVTHRRMAAAAAVLSLSVVGGVAISTGMSAANTTSGAAGSTGTHAALRPLNNAAASGQAQVVVSGNNLQVVLQARRLLKGMPHAQHIHFGAQARNECPNVRDDDNHDHRINTVEGIPAYGPVRVSLTKRGDTSPDSTLAVNRFPTAPEGKVAYSRTISVSDRLAERIAAGKAVIVVHGIDYNRNGKYDFRAAGASELDPSLPAEATDPALCGVLRVGDSQNGALTDLLENIGNS